MIYCVNVPFMSQFCWIEAAFFRLGFPPFADSIYMFHISPRSIPHVCWAIDFSMKAFQNYCPKHRHGLPDSRCQVIRIAFFFEDTVPLNTDLSMV